MRAHRYAVAIALLPGCMSTPGVHATLHPSAPGTGTNGGVALGTAITTANDETSMQVGYGEGWVRMGPGGALELRSTPQAAFLAYELPLSSGKTAVSIRPSFGLSIFRGTQSSGMGMSESETVMLLHPGATLVVNANNLYVAPRFGIGISSVLEGNGEGETAVSGGVTGGFRLGRGYSLEVSVIYSRGEEDSMGNVPDAWSFVPSLGVSVP